MTWFARNGTRGFVTIRPRVPLLPSQPSAPIPPDLPDSRAEWRKHLVAAEMKQQEDLDKALLSLSGGALGVSLVFLKDIVGTKELVWPWLITASWVSWGLAVSCVLISYYTSIETCHRDIERMDGKRLDLDQNKKDGAHRLTKWMNWSSGALFMAGVIAMSGFAANNFGNQKKGTDDGNKPAASASAPFGSGEPRTVTINTTTWLCAAESPASAGSQAARSGEHRQKRLPAAKPSPKQGACPAKDASASSSAGT